jgi:hypothetical protein
MKLSFLFLSSRLFSGNFSEREGSGNISTL